MAMMKSMNHDLKVMSGEEATMSSSSSTTTTTIFNAPASVSLERKGPIDLRDGGIQTLRKKRFNSLMMLPQNPLIENIRSSSRNTLIRSSSGGDIKMTRTEEGLHNTCGNDDKMERKSPPKRSSSNIFLRNLLTQKKGWSDGLSVTFPGVVGATRGQLKSTKSSSTLEDLTDFSTGSHGSSSFNEGSLLPFPNARNGQTTTSNVRSSTLKRPGSSFSLRNSLPRSERSGNSLNVSTGSKLMITRSCAKLEDMRSYAIDKTSSCGRNLSSQALNALAKISASPQSDSGQDPVFFSMIQYNPMDAEERAKYDDLAVRKYIRRHPESLRAKYDFQVGGRGKLTVSRYPLSALVALGANLSTVRLAIKANPSALEATEDFHSTTLHTACSFDTDIEVVRYIYNKHPPAIHKTTKLVYLPIHNACQASSKKNPMLEILRFLVEEYPEGLMAINKLGDTPFRTAQRNGSVPKEVLDFLEEETQRIFGMEENSETFTYVSERQSWGSSSRELSEELLLEKTILAVDDSSNEQPFDESSSATAVQSTPGWKTSLASNHTTTAITAG